MSEFWLGWLVGDLVTAFVGSVFLLVVSRAYRRGKFDGYQQIMDAYPDPPETSEPMAPIKKGKRTRTMFGDCDEQGRYGKAEKPFGYDSNTLGSDK